MIYSGTPHKQARISRYKLRDIYGVRDESGEGPTIHGKQLNAVHYLFASTKTLAMLIHKTQGNIK